MKEQRPTWNSKNLNLDLKYGGVYSAHTQTHGGQAMFSFRF
jgi:hypothetical protein